jgi:hypothetical protein
MGELATALQAKLLRVLQEHSSDELAEPGRSRLIPAHRQPTGIWRGHEVRIIPAGFVPAQNCC